jgi:tetratricopeptide (TPR) repeat protein
VPKKLRDEIVIHAEGNPYFMEEVIKMLIEDRVIQVEGDKWLVEESRLENLRVPPTLAGLLQARIDTLLYPEKLLLQRASVVGRIFYDGVMRTIDKADTTHLDDIRTILDSLVEREFIYQRETSAFEGQTEYIFAQQMMREVIYDGLLRRQLATYHGATAEWLNRAAGERRDEYLSLIAEHYELGGMNELAADFLSQAAERAILVSAINDAHSFLLRALKILPEDAQEKRASLHIDLGEFLTFSVDSLQAKDHLETGLELARTLDNVYLQARALAHLSQVFTLLGDFDQASAYIDEAVGMDVDDQLLRINILLSLGNLNWRRNDLEKAHESAVEALNLAQDIGNQLLILKALNQLGIITIHRQKYSGAQDHFDEVYSLALEIGNRDSAGSARNNTGEILRLQGDLVGASEAYSDALEIGREIGSPLKIWVAHVNLGLIAISLRDPKSARSHFTTLLRSTDEIGGQTAQLYVVVVLAGAMTLDGDVDTALAWLGMVKAHPAASADIHIDMDGILEILGESLTQQEIESGMEKGRDLDLDELMDLISEEYGQG